MNYPEPQELREFAQEPVPFHKIHASDLELLSDGRIRVGYENVEYVYHPTYLLEELENSNGERERYEYPNWPVSASEIFEDSVEWEIVEDYICTTFTVDGWYEIYWVIEDITIENPELYS
jgi:hypothetical protein